jgi:hypothetical protein
MRKATIAAIALLATGGTFYFIFLATSVQKRISRKEGADMADCFEEGYFFH